MTKIGRPKAEKPKNIKFGIRLDKDTEVKLLRYCEQENTTKGEAIRRAIMLLPEK